MTWTISQAAREWGLGRTTLTKRMISEGFDIKRKKKWHTREIQQGVSGSWMESKIKLAKSEEALNQIKLREKSGEATAKARSEAEKIITETLAPVRSKLLSWPTTLASRLNPTDPELARRELETALKEIFK